ncbi:MAG: LamG domain-containing protein [Peptococcia bacterium]|jgi:hypothetical protein
MAWGPWNYRQDPNQPPTVDFTGLPQGSTVYKSDKDLTFKIKVVDPPAQADEYLSTEFYLNIGGAFLPVNNFTANGNKVTNGQLSAKNGTEYVITMDKKALVPSAIDKFHIKVVTTDSFGQQAAKTVTLNHTEKVPVITFSRLPADLKMYKSEQTLSFNAKVTMAEPTVKNMNTEFYIDAGSGAKKVTHFTVNGVPVTNGVFSAINGMDYAITIEKAAYVPFTSNNFTIRAVAKEPNGKEGMNEVSLVHYTDVLAKLTFNYIADRTAFDTGGNNNHGIIHGAAAVTGVSGDALEFDGIDDYVEVPLTPSLTITIGSFSVEAWVKTTDVPIANDGIVGNYRTTTTPHWMLMHCGDVPADRGKLCFSVRDEKAVTASIKTTTPMNDGKWYHLVGVRDIEQKKVRFYVDGALVGEAEAPLGNINSGQSIWIGDTLSRYFKGSIDEVTIYDRVLTAEEVADKYNKLVFVDNIKIMHKDNNGVSTTSRTCILGTDSINQVEFDLKKEVNGLELGLNLPSNIKPIHIRSVYQDGVLIDNPVTAIEGNKLVFDQTLTPGHYTIEFVLRLDNKINISSEFYGERNGTTANYESPPFEFTVVDLPNLL